MASAAADMGMGQNSAQEVQRRVLEILEQGRADTTMCPSDVARKLDPGSWRALMPTVRAAAFALADAGRVEVLQRGVVVEGRGSRGAIRLRALRP